MLVKILEMDASRSGAVSALVKRVFPLEGHIFSWAYTASEDSVLRKIGMWVFRIREITTVWAALDDDDKVVGTIGLLRRWHDTDEVFWLMYFCVAPEARGAGIGSGLLDLAIEKARQNGAAFLRLHTSDTPDAVDAQRLYESRGLHVYKTRNLILFNLLYREKPLHSGERAAEG